MTLKLKKAAIEQDENGNNVLTEKFIRDLCYENGQYDTPHLNDTLYLHYKGRFQKRDNVYL